MTKPIVILIRATVPPELGHAWLQHMRDFDKAHPDGCEFEVLAETNLTVDEMVEMLKVDPPFPNLVVKERG